MGALVAAVEFGLQPTLFHTADGTPLYAPFHLSQTIPAMAFAHLTVAGFVEFALTVGVIAYLQRANLPLMRLNHAGVATTDAELERRPVSWRWAFYGLGAMVLLSPLGLLAPGGAFGEDCAGGSRPRQVRARRRAAGPQRLQPAGGATRCSAATASPADRTRASATSCRPSSARSPSASRSRSSSC